MADRPSRPKALDLLGRFEAFEDEAGAVLTEAFVRHMGPFAGGAEAFVECIE